METLLDIAVRSGAILAISLGAASILRKKLSAAEKHTILLLGLLAALLLPLGMVVMPRTTIEVPPVIAEKRALAPSMGAAPPALAEAFPSTFTATNPFNPWPLTRAILIIGGAYQAALILLGLWSIGKWRRASVPLVIEQPVLDLLADHGKELSAVLISPKARIGMVAGWIRPVILLPEGAKTWTPEKLAMVLCHEAAHIRRKDHWVLPLLAFARVVYWWHPLASIAQRRLREERERACDDIVLSARFDSVSYAHLLLDAASRSLGARFSATALAVTARSPIHRRITAILEPNEQRHPGRRLATLAMILSSVGAYALFSSASLELENTPTFQDLEFLSLAESDPNTPLVVNVGLLSLTEGAYRENLAAIDSAMATQDISAFRKLMWRLDESEDVELTTSRIVMQPGHESKISSIREFPFPNAFEETSDGRSHPTKFERVNLGLEIPIFATVTRSSIKLQGKVIITELEGTTPTDEGAFSPAFQTSEAHFRRTIKAGKFDGFWVPGTHDFNLENSGNNTLQNLYQGSGSSGKVSIRKGPPRRIAVFFTAYSQKSPTPPPSTLSSVLKSKRIGLFKLGEVSLADFAGRFREALSIIYPTLTLELPAETDTTKNSTQIVRMNLNNPRGIDVLEELRLQTGIGYRIGGSSIELLRGEEPKSAPPSAPALNEKSIPYGIWVPGKIGFVQSPYAPDKGYVDLRGFPQGSEVKCPYTGKIFLVP